MKGDEMSAAKEEEHPHQGEVYSAERAGHISNPLRRLFNNPKRLLAPLVGEGDTVVDLGCGPGYFTLPLAEMVGKNGCVIAVDVQEDMLTTLGVHAEEAGLDSRITPLLAAPDNPGVTVVADFALAFWVLHETPDQLRFLEHTYSMLKPGGRLLLAEPLGHVSKKRFEEVIGIARNVGYELASRPRTGFSHTALFAKPA